MRRGPSGWTVQTHGLRGRWPGRGRELSEPLGVGFPDSEAFRPVELDDPMGCGVDAPWWVGWGVQVWLRRELTDGWTLNFVTPRGEVCSPRVWAPRGVGWGVPLQPGRESDGGTNTRRTDSRASWILLGMRWRAVRRSRCASCEQAAGLCHVFPSPDDPPDSTRAAASS